MPAAYAGEAHTLNAGDSIYYDGDCMHGFRNPSRVSCVYLPSNGRLGRRGRNQSSSGTASDRVRQRDGFAHARNRFCAPQNTAPSQSAEGGRP